MTDVKISTFCEKYGGMRLYITKWTLRWINSQRIDFFFKNGPSTFTRCCSQLGTCLWYRKSLVQIWFGMTGKLSVHPAVNIHRDMEGSGSELRGEFLYSSYHAIWAVHFSCSNPTPFYHTLHTRSLKYCLIT